MPGLDVVKILGLGVIGLGYLLALLAYRLLGKIQIQPNPNHAVLRSIYFFMGFSIALCGIGFASQIFDQHRSREQYEKELNELNIKIEHLVHGPFPKVSGNIKAPAYGSVVRNTFDCSGTAKGLTQDAHLWLAAEVNGFIWPKEKELEVTDGKWSTKVFEDGSGSKFSLVLIAADEVAHANIQEWLAIGQTKGGIYERMISIGGTVRKFDRIDDLRLENKP